MYSIKVVDAAKYLVPRDLYSHNCCPMTASTVAASKQWSSSKLKLLRSASCEHVNDTIKTHDDKSNLKNKVDDRTELVSLRHERICVRRKIDIDPFQELLSALLDSVWTESSEDMTC